MTQHTKENANKKPAPIYIVSGGSGASGEQLVETVLAQFPDFQIPIVKKIHTRLKEQIKDIIIKASSEDATIVHTLVDPDLREYLVHLADKDNVVTIDLMGPLINHLIRVLAEQPKGQPGLYRKLHQTYFERVDAIDFTMSHDDGMNSHELHLADIILIGVSRSGKTPLSMYLAVLGWKVANVPIVPNVPLPGELFQMDRRRIFGLHIEYERLLNHRRKRQKRLGYQMSSYTNPKKVFDEIETATHLYNKHGFTVIGVSNKPMETSADEIIEKITRRFELKSQTVL